MEHQRFAHRTPGLESLTTVLHRRCNESVIHALPLEFIIKADPGGGLGKSKRLRVINLIIVLPIQTRVRHAGSMGSQFNNRLGESAKNKFHHANSSDGPEEEGVSQKTF